jgi:hypothetical protein
MYVRIAYFSATPQMGEFWLKHKLFVVDPVVQPHINLNNQKTGKSGQQQRKPYMRGKPGIVTGHNHPAHGKTKNQHHGPNQDPAGEIGIIPWRYGFSKKWILIKLHGALV